MTDRFRCPICPLGADEQLKTKAGTSEVRQIEKKTEQGKTVYEARREQKRHRWSIEVDANGKFLKQYKESEEKEKDERSNCVKLGRAPRRPGPFASGLFDTHHMKIQNG